MEKNKPVRVRDLIQALSKLDPNMPVIWADHYRQEIATQDSIRVGGGNLVFFPNKPAYLKVPFWDITEPLIKDDEAGSSCQKS